MSAKADKKTRILAVDDDASISRLLGMIYGGTYEMETAGTIKTATDLLQRKTYDALVLDVHLPDGLGTELLRALRQEPGFASCRDLPVVMLTSSGVGNIYEASWDLGSIAYVRKPFDVADLSAAIEQALSARQEA